MSRTHVAWLMLLTVCASVHSDWKLDRVMISAWGAPSDDATAQAYVDAGFNTVMATAELLDLCARHGLRVLTPLQFDAAYNQPPCALPEPP